MEYSSQNHPRLCVMLQQSTCSNKDFHDEENFLFFTFFFLSKTKDDFMCKFSVILYQWNASCHDCPHAVRELAQSLMSCSRYARVQCHREYLEEPCDIPFACHTLPLKEIQRFLKESRILTDIMGRGTRACQAGLPGESRSHCWWLNSTL